MKEEGKGTLWPTGRVHLLHPTAVWGSLLPCVMAAPGLTFLPASLHIQANMPALPASTLHSPSGLSG